MAIVAMLSLTLHALVSRPVSACLKVEAFVIDVLLSQPPICSTGNNVCFRWINILKTDLPDKAGVDLSV